MTAIEVQIDLEARAAYVALSANEVARTVEVAPNVLVDLDNLEIAVGIEVLQLDAEIPHEELRSRFHVHSDVIHALDNIRPSVGKFFNVGRGSDGEATGSGVLELADV
jgi:hypothetical protein